MIRKHYILFILIFCGYVFNAAKPDSLSLETALGIANTPIQKVKANVALAKFYLSRSLTIASTYVSAAKSIAQKSNYKEGQAEVFTLEGEINYSLANYDLAKSNYTEALSLLNKEKQQLTIGETYSGLGKIAYKQEEFDASITHYSEALKIFEKYNYKDGLAAIYINLALLYEDMQNQPQAIEYYNKSLVIALENNDIVAEASCYTNLGNVYSDQENYDKAIEYLEKSLKIKREIGNKKGEGSSLNNLGATYYAMHNEGKALQYFLEAYQIYMNINDIKSSFPSCNNIGAIYYERKEYDKALEFYTKAYNLSKQLGSISKKILCLESLTLLYRDMGDYKKAVDFSVECWSLKDTLYNKDQAEITTEIQTRFATEKNQKENEILNLQIKSESFIKTIFIGVTCLLLLIAIYILWSLRQKQKINNALHEKNKIIEEQKLTVENQKQVVEEQHKDITDSIKYAERIQQAILPPEQQWKSLFSESFVLYKPKDILSGDFYWAEQKGDLLFVAAADCTGHGVPGALISIVNYNLLNKAVLEKDLNDPADVLNYVNMQLIVALHQTYQDSSVKDGMDISLCVINTKTLELKYAGANNPMYIISNNQLEQLSPDKFPVGAFIEDKVQSFVAKQRQLQKGDSIYLFSDGFADQFGGPKGKKFKYKQLKDNLLEIQQLPMNKQSIVLTNNLTTWQGNLEQVDDILIIGIRI